MWPSKIASFFFAEGFARFDFNGFELFGGFATAFDKARDFLINLIGRNFLPVDNDFIFLQQKCLAESDTR
ncbi:hypothetical protein HA44_14425 [Mixta gaviniae]|nr:hypothetical protein HA44_14425 [Mixta gaviniae]